MVGGGETVSFALLSSLPMKKEFWYTLKCLVGFQSHSGYDSEEKKASRDSSCITSRCDIEKLSIKPHFWVFLLVSMKAQYKTGLARSIFSVICHQSQLICWRKMSEHISGNQ
jgi:hypothetical protein